ncbi:uncharacterized protein UTRI_03079_B [Ustilago trichophora]|uniref:Protein kinase domain-containing protein n=1 Tax=Ustilago trichophora TaxID=86804 RepID=A0A5C3E7L8_9BASI|nr:uncharacterized protein UTRI_03079_B [Ustilago trichophora]
MPATLGDATEAASSSNGQQGPPAIIEFALGGKRMVRYHRMARSGDADAAVLGKGGFGCVYRYAIDTSFTPPSSMDLALNLHYASAHRHASALDSSPPVGLHKRRAELVEDVAATNPGIKPPSLVAVKLCRTPCSGSFDELQKTSLIDKKTRRAEMQDDSKTHVRIVRGEGRIFQYLQAARQASSRTSDPPLVKLLANLSPAGTRREAQLDAMDVSLDEEDGPPTRLLVFEKLIELDAERTPQGWTKSKRTWTHERVEKVSFEVMQGLQFLHEHNVTHGDLKPSNLMLDPRTGVVKIIDLGASRRFVHLSNKERNNRCAVEEQDRHALACNKSPMRLAPELCEGLGSLTGSPYYMAPEILLQATRYVDVSGRGRSVLEDYEFDYPSFLPREQWPMYQIGLSDLRRGWGIRADIWSWACTVQALLLKTVEEDQRPSSSTISPYDFSFSRHRDEMIEPLYEKSPGEDDVPRFHQWCRVLPLLIVRIALEPVPLIAQADGCSPGLRSALKASLRHQDLRPTADDLLEALEASRPSSARMSGRRSHTPNHMSPRATSHDKAQRHSQHVAIGDVTTSPQTSGSELESSRYATPPLSQGASSVSTPQHTCETASKSCVERTPDRDRKVRFETSSSESAFFPAPTLESHLSAEAERGANDPVPQGFELVSPNRPPKLRSTTFGDAPRPATANATMQSLGGTFGSARSLRPEMSSGSRWSRSHPSTPSSTVGEAMQSRPRTSPRLTARDLGQEYQNLEASQQISASAQMKAECLSGACPPVSEGLGISWPLEGMRSLQLNSPRPGYQRQSVIGSVPSSPMAHSRGASVPLFGTTEKRGGPVRMPQPVALPSRPDGQDIGGSPRCTVGESKSLRQSSLMATLKEKQVRLKQSSRKLMARRGSGIRMGQESGAGHGDDHVMEMSEALSHTGMYAGEARPFTESNVDNSVMASPEFSSRYTSKSCSSGRHGGSSSRRSSNRTGDEGSPSKPLLRRLLTWSTNS